MSCRLGRVLLHPTPSLSSSAIGTLQGPGGQKEFRKIYGDYYVCGYELGADAGATLSAINKSSRSDETLILTVAVKVLFFEESVSTSTTTSMANASSSLKFNGYSTLHGDQKSITSETISSSSQVDLQQEASIYLKKVASLDHVARTTLQNLGLQDQQALPLSDCSKLCQSGLVVQLLLAPLARLNEFVNLIGCSGTASAF